VGKQLTCYYTRVFKIINQENNNPLSTNRMPYQTVTDPSAKKYGTPSLILRLRIAIFLNMYSNVQSAGKA
jgi:hypothetical protein